MATAKQKKCPHVKLVIVVTTVFIMFKLFPAVSSVASIQEIINSASPGEKIFVVSGEYAEQLIIDKPLRLVGEDPHSVVINANGKGHVITVKSDNVIIESLTIKNGESDYSGVYINNAKNISIINCIITDCRIGIKIDSSSNLRIYGCVIFNSTLAAVRAWGFSASIEIENNTIFKNNFGISLLTFTKNITLLANVVYENCIGVALINSQENQIAKNQLYNNRYGLYLEDRLTINNTISKNHIFNNTFGVYVNILREDCAGNIFWHNNFINNVKQVFFEQLFYPINHWNLSYPLGGNYWSDHIGVDLNSGIYQNVTGADGFTDNYYYIAKNNIDFYPLSSPYIEESQTPTGKGGLELQIIFAIAITIAVYATTLLMTRRLTHKKETAKDARKPLKMLFMFLPCVCAYSQYMLLQLRG